MLRCSIISANPDDNGMDKSAILMDVSAKYSIE